MAVSMASSNRPTVRNRYCGQGPLRCGALEHPQFGGEPGEDAVISSFRNKSCCPALQDVTHLEQFIDVLQ
jgi:hypothetical protein